MRTKQNLKKFLHVDKTPQQRASYADAVEGTSRESGLPDDFDETDVSAEREGKEEKIEPKSVVPAYRSWGVWLEENKWEIGSAGICLPLVIWILSSLWVHGVDIAVLKVQQTSSESNISTLEEKYDTLNDKVIKSETILEQRLLAPKAAPNQGPNVLP